jgi:hypothetical protein
MGYQTYLLIIACYAGGCACACKIGYQHGFKEGVSRTIHFLSDKTGLSILEIASLLLGKKQTRHSGTQTKAIRKL